MDAGDVSSGAGDVNLYLEGSLGCEVEAPVAGKVLKIHGRTD